MNNQAICPCEAPIDSSVIDNLPDLDSISYRAGDFTSFRHALLLPLLDDHGKQIETELRLWRPAPNSDLGLQLIEWWAYIADILTFYNERIANETYLRTAIQPGSVQRIIQLLGYRPRPGIGAKGYVAALLASGVKRAILPQGMGLQNKPSPGKQPQIFELEQRLTVGLPDSLSADISPEAIPDTVNMQFSYAQIRQKVIPFLSKASYIPVSSAILALPANSVNDSLLLKGEISGLKSGQSLLLVEKNWNGASSNFRWLTLVETSIEKSPRGNANTRINYETTDALWSGFDVRNTQLLSPAQTAHLWPISGTTGIVDGNKVHLDKLVKQIGTGDRLLFEDGSNSGLFLVSSYEEALWYANAPDQNHPETPPDPSTTPPVAVLHSLPGMSSASLPDWLSDSESTKINIHYVWKDIGQLIIPPVTIIDSKNTILSSLTAVDANGTQTTGTAFPANLNNATIFIEDMDGLGVTANASTNSTGSQLTLSELPEQDYVLKPPLKVLFNLLSVSRGKTISNEVLGSGNASVQGQEFVLKNAPLTYFQSADSSSGGNYKSTLRVWVDDIEWMEVPNFFGRTSNERIFVTREDESGITHVLFGDGINGARLSSGSNNIIASYRFGSGAEAPPVNSLTVILQPQPGLKAIRNPIAIGGGSDPDAVSKIRRLAPRSVLTFGRAVSADDYEVIAAQAPGVNRAKSVWNIDAKSQKAMPIIYVGDDASAVTSARKAINLAADPNRPFTVSQAKKIPIQLQLTLNIASNYSTQPVMDAVLEQLTDEDSGLFGLNNVGIGQAFFQSQLDSVCLNTNGVVAVHELHLWSDTGNGFIEETDSKYDPGIDGFYSLALENLKLSFQQVNL